MGDGARAVGNSQGGGLQTMSVSLWFQRVMRHVCWRGEYPYLSNRVSLAVVDD